MSEIEKPTTTTTEVAQASQQALSPVKKFELTLEQYKPTMGQLLQAHGMSVESFYVTALNAVKKEPKLLNADPRTLFGAILMSAELGLPPNTPMQLSHIIAYNRTYKEGSTFKKVAEAQFQIGYQGWIEIMLRNPSIESVDSGTVYDNEEWHYDKGLRNPFSHKPLPPSKRGNPVGSYAIAWLKGSPKPKVVFLYDEEILQFKKISQGASSEYSPWNDSDKDPQRWMYRKTCIKQLAKEVPKTYQIQRAYEQDTVADLGGSQIVDDTGRAIPIESDYMKSQKSLEQKESRDNAVQDTMNKELFPGK